MSVTDERLLSCHNVPLGKCPEIHVPLHRRAPQMVRACPRKCWIRTQCRFKQNTPHRAAPRRNKQSRILRLVHEFRPSTFMLTCANMIDASSNNELAYAAGKLVARHQRGFIRGHLRDGNSHLRSGSPASELSHDWVSEVLRRLHMSPRLVASVTSQYDHLPHHDDPPY